MDWRGKLGYSVSCELGIILEFSLDTSSGWEPFRGLPRELGNIELLQKTNTTLEKRLAKAGISGLRMHVVP